jgi:hypothetical protein
MQFTTFVDTVELDDRNYHPSLLYPSDANEDAQFFGYMLPNYEGGGLTVRVGYTSESGAGDVDFDVSIERNVSQDLTSDGYASAVSQDNNAVPATSGVMDVVEVVLSDGAQIDNLAADEPFRLKLLRDTADTTANTHIHFIEVRET